MTNRERKLLTRTALLGVMLTLLVVAAERVGLLDPLERWLYDLRARTCQFFTPPPTDRLVHLDIDDGSLETIRRWPWPRTYLALILDELHRAGAKTVAMDLILSDPQEPELVEGSDGKPIRIDHDQALAEAVKKFGNAIVPIAFESVQYSERYKEFREKLLRDLEIDLEQGELNIASGADADRALRARTEAMYLRIDRELQEHGDATAADLRQKLLPRTPAHILSPLTRLLAGQYDRAVASRALRRLVPPSAADKGLQWVHLDQGVPPVSALAAAAGATGFVYYEADADGVVRSIPLWVEHQGHLYPQLGLALACAQLKVNIAAVRIERDRVVIPASAGNIVLPVSRRYYRTLGKSCDLALALPMFGKEDWATMLDPKHERSDDHHVPIHAVWDVVLVEKRIRENNAQADDAVKFAFFKSDAAKLKAYETNPLDVNDPLARQKVIGELLADEYLIGTIKINKDDIAAGNKPDEDNQKLLAAWDALTAVHGENPRLAKQLADSRDTLTRQFKDRAVLIGWTATGALADFVPTTIHGRCPGVVVHGVVFNAVMTGEAWRDAGDNINSAVTLLVGLLTVALLVLLTPGWATLAAFLLAGGYLAMNGLILFDRGNLIVGAAGPLAAAIAAWGGCLLFRFITERAERARIQRRFQSYVDPVLVDYVIEHPEQSRLDGEMRNLTVVFTDLQGFTTLSEKLGEKTIAMLNEYMELMVPVIRERQGYVNKFLGDGIMFFFGAPLESGYHARDAVLTAFKMQELMVPFNKSLEERGLPTLHMRIGISSGPMVVGDAGPESASDYTVIGDTVNLAARLEAANKYTGTWIMMNDGAAQLVGDQFLLRPIGRLQVVGKSEGIMTWNPQCNRHDASPEQLKLVELTSAMIEAYKTQNFQGCIEACAALDKAFGQSKLTHLYQRLAEQYLTTPPGADFAGTIVLESK